MTDAGGNVTGWAYTPLPPSVALAVDPERGRVAFAQDQARPPLVTFHYGFSANVGGGEYVRLASINGKLETVVRVASTFIADDSGMPPNVIEIEFTGGPADRDSVRDGATFVVRRTTFGLNVNVQVLTGELTWPSPNVVRWTTLEARPLAAGNYSVALLGSRDPSPNATTTDTVRSVDGRALDGELWQLPSGDNGDGGNFAFAVQVI